MKDEQADIETCAKLMTASSDMLEALKSARVELMTCQQLLSSAVQKGEIQLTLDKIEQAIKKATE